MIRKDVYALAGRLNSAAALGTDAIYSFLMQAGKALGKNPRLFNWIATPGRVYLESNPHGYSLEKYQAPQPWQHVDEARADYWENRILERQEAWQD